MFPPQAGLSFEQAPPISVPFRFFLTAPLFLLAAAGLLAWFGPAALIMRQAPATLAITHLLTLGVMSMTMCGALMQMLPVIAGSPIVQPRLTAALCHGLLTLGTPLLAAAFLSGNHALSLAATAILGGGFGVFILAAGLSLARVRSYNSTVLAMGLAALALAVAIPLGMLLLLARIGALDISYIRYAELHPLWGSIGWTALLIIGVAYQVVPMFLMTPDYPKRLTHLLTPALFLLLAAKSAVVLLDAPPLWNMASDIGLATGLILFALTTLTLQAKRKRRLASPTQSYWRLAMGALILASLGGVILRWMPVPYAETLKFFLGVLFITGFVLGVISGMLYKMVPFLAWFHLQSRHLRQVPIPNMKTLMPDARALAQMRVWLGALVTLAAAVAFPRIFTYPAALLLAVAALWLEWNLIATVRSYRATKRLAMAKNI